jgi:hypothetical protein
MLIICSSFCAPCNQYINPHIYKLPSSPHAFDGKVLALLSSLPCSKKLSIIHDKMQKTVQGRRREERQEIKRPTSDEKISRT